MIGDHQTSSSGLVAAEDERLHVSQEMILAGYEELERHYLGDGIYDLRPSTLIALYQAMLVAAS